MKTRFEHSAGGVVVRPADGSFDVVLASRRTRRGGIAWGLPKGLIEPGEEPVAAAIREVREETGLDAGVLEPLGDISYWFVWDRERVKKEVSFFLMEATGGDASRRDDEMEEVRWFPLDEAVAAASYPSERDVLRRAARSLGVPA